MRELDESLYLFVRIRKENGIWCSSHYSISNTEEVRKNLDAITIYEIKSTNNTVVGEDFSKSFNR